MTIYTDGYGGDTFTAKDARVNSAQGTYNYGAATTCDPASSDSKILLFFDLSAIPAGSVCNSATLYLYNAATKTSDRTLTIYSILSGNSGWVEGTRSGAQALSTECCWNAKAADGSGGVTTSWAGSAGLSTSGTDYNATSIGSMTYPASAATGTEMTASLTTSVVDDWFGSNDNNFGIVAWTASGSAFPACYSSDYTTDTSKRPKLVIDYTASGGTEYPQTVAGTLTTAGVVVRLAQKWPGGSLSSAGTIARLAQIARGGSLGSAGGLIRQAGKILAGALGGGSTGTFTDGYSGDVATYVDVNLHSTAGSGTYNGGLHPAIQFGSYNNGLMRFDLSTLSGKIITSATLYLGLYEGGGTADIYAVLPANDGWVEGTKNLALAAAGEPCWNALAADGAGGITTAWAGGSNGCGVVGTDISSSAIGTLSSGSAGVIEVALDVDAVQDAVGGDFDILIKPTTTNSNHIALAEYATESYRPKLVVEYSTPGGLSGALATSLTFLATLAGTLSSAGSTVRQTAKNVAGTLSSAGGVSRSISKIVSGAIISAGSLAKQAGKIVSGILSSAGALVGDLVSGLFYQDAGGSLGLAGSISRQTGRLVSGAVTSAGTLARQVDKITGGVLSSAGGLVAGLVTEVFEQAVGGAISLAGTLSRQAQIARGGTLASSGGVGKLISRALGGLLGLAAALVSAIVGLPVPADQTFTIPAEDRVYRVPAEDRTYRVPAKKL